MRGSAFEWPQSGSVITAHLGPADISRRYAHFESLLAPLCKRAISLQEATCTHALDCKANFGTAEATTEK